MQKRVMGLDHIRFALIVASLSVCLFASSGNEMEITRFSRTYMLTHPERVGQLTESISRLYEKEKVTKAESLPPKEQRRHLKKRRTVREFQMRHKTSSCNEMETYLGESFSEALSVTQGTASDQQDVCWSPGYLYPVQRCMSENASCGRWNCDNHESRESTATYFDSVSSEDTGRECQKVSLQQLNSSQLTIGENRTSGEGRDVMQKDQKVYRHETDNIPSAVDGNDDDYHPYKPIFFVYPPKRPTTLGKRRKGERSDDIMDYYRQTFHLELDSQESCFGQESRCWNSLEYDPGIRGGFDSYGEDVSIYFSQSDVYGSAGLRYKSNDVCARGKEKDTGSTVVNESSYFDELCKVLLSLECG